MSKTLKAIIISTSSIIALAIIIPVIAYFLIITPRTVTPVLNSSLKNFYQGIDIRFESVDISIIPALPYLDISLNNGMLVNTVFKAHGEDTILIFETATLSVNIMDFLRDDKIIIKKLNINNAIINYKNDTNDVYNWQPIVDEPSSGGDFYLDIDNISLNNSIINYQDSKSSLFCNARNVNMNTPIVMTTDNANNIDTMYAKVNAAFNINNVKMPNFTLNKNIPLNIDMAFFYDFIAGNMNFSDAILNIAGVKFSLDGYLKDTIYNNPKKTTDSNTYTNVDITMKLSSTIDDFYALIPKEIKDSLPKIDIYGDFNIDATCRGLMGDDMLPTIDIAANLDNCKFDIIQNTKKISIYNELLSNAHIDFNKTTKSYFSISKCKIFTNAIYADLTVNIDSLFEDKSPIKITSKSNIDLTKLSYITDSFRDGFKAKGKITTDFKVHCNLQDVMNFSDTTFNKIKLFANFDIDSVNISDSLMNLSFETGVLRGRTATNYVMKSRRSNRERDVLATQRIYTDRFKFCYDNICVKSDTSSLMFSLTRPKDTTEGMSVMTMAYIEKLEFYQDSTRLKMDTAKGRVMISNLKNPSFGINFALVGMKGRIGNTMSSRIKNGSLNLTIAPRQRVRRTRTSQDSTLIFTSQDSTLISRRTRTSQDSLGRNIFAQNRAKQQAELATGERMNLRLSDSSTRVMLNKWEVKGKLNLEKATIRTPYIPLSSSVDKMSVRIYFPDSICIDTMNLSLKEPRKRDRGNRQNTANNLSESIANTPQMKPMTMNLSGNISNIQRAFTRNDKLSLNILLKADTLDLNVLTNTFLYANQFAAKPQAERDSIGISNINSNNDDNTVVDTIPSKATAVFVIPKNIDLTLKTRISHTVFYLSDSLVEIEKMRLTLLIKNQTLEIPRMSVKSNVGDIYFSLLYKATTQKESNIGLSLMLSKIDIYDLLARAPMLKENIPMLSAFEGVVNCKIKGSFETDSAMNIIFPNALVSASITGRNLKIMDGDVFRSIAKEYHLNKDFKPIIDSISIDMMLENNELLIFPFIAIMGEYSFAAGGSQSIDGNFNYHITPIKLPMGLVNAIANISGRGVDIYGNLEKDEIKWKLVKARYKNLQDPVKRESLTGHLYNIRNELEKTLEDYIKQLSVSGTQNQRRRTPLIQESLKNELFKTDTVN
ncbi:hypothetical protein FACS1894153_3320 [Bacteroidia bacterium]|nr:hypothetical protein FACS1894153_3320 [Bacteroidia bacterium]